MSRFAILALQRTLVVAGAALLAACGGGSSDTAAVSNILMSNLRMGLASTISVSGRNLTSTTVKIEGPCQNLTRVTSSTDDLLQYTCDVKGIGVVKAFVVDGNGQSVGQVSAEVPAPRVSVVTSKGSFVIDLDAEKAPNTVLNFLAYVNLSFYTSTIVDTAIKDRGIMGGAYTYSSTTGVYTAKTTTRTSVDSESSNGLKNVRGAVGLYHGASANSGNFRWYVNTATNTDLDYVDAATPGYTVFGTVSSGLDVVDTISALDTRPDLVSGLGAVPATNVTITSVTQVR